MQSKGTKRRTQEVLRTLKRKIVVAKVEESKREELFDEENEGECSWKRYFG